MARLLLQEVTVLLPLCVAPGCDPKLLQGGNAASLRLKRLMSVLMATALGVLLVSAGELFHLVRVSKI